MCLAGTCESVYEQKLYDTVEECQVASQEVKDYALANFPYSNGEVWCLTETEFKKYLEYYGITQDT